MPAKSKAQKKFMQLALGVKTGDIDKSEVSQDVVDAAEDMSKSELEKYANEPVEEQLRRVVREELQDVMREDHLAQNQLDQLDETVQNLGRVIGNLEREAQNINMMYGDGGQNSEWLNSFVDDLVSGSNGYYEKLQEFKVKLKEEYPDYDWGFTVPSHNFDI